MIKEPLDHPFGRAYVRARKRKCRSYRLRRVSKVVATGQISGCTPSSFLVAHPKHVRIVAKLYVLTEEAWAFSLLGRRTECALTRTLNFDPACHRSRLVCARLSSVAPGVNGPGLSHTPYQFIQIGLLIGLAPWSRTPVLLARAHITYTTHATLNFMYQEIPTLPSQSMFGAVDSVDALGTRD